MKMLRVFALVCLSIGLAYGQGAGRAIPIASENFAMDLFGQINSDIDYDTTNFLVDLAGNYANCDYIGQRRHDEIDKLGPNGETIGLIQDFTDGDETHTEAVDSYLRQVFRDWVNRDRVPNGYAQIRNARRFGCSVRPGCRGQVSVACLFSPFYDSGFPPRPPPFGEQEAKAFTPHQYAMAEGVTNQNWDRSYFLENLSGFETKCSLIHTRGHEFTDAIDEAENHGMIVRGRYGWAKNEDDVPKALEAILRDMRMTQMHAEKIGCSLIPDCMAPDEYGRNTMYVVVSCIFEI